MPKKNIRILFFCLILPAIGFSQYPEKRVLKSMDANQLEKAKKQLMKIENKVDSLKFLYLSAKIDRKTGDYESAERILNQILKVQPNNSYAIAELGVLKAIDEDYTGAVLLFEKAIRLNGKEDEFDNSLGATHFMNKHYKEAIDAFYNAIQNDAKNDYAWCNLGLCYKALEQYDKAIECFNKSLKYRRNDPKTMYERGLAYYKTGKYKEALHDFKRSYRKRQQENFYELIPEEDYRYFIEQCEKRLR